MCVCVCKLIHLIQTLAPMNLDIAVSSHADMKMRKQSCAADEADIRFAPRSWEGGGRAKKKKEWKERKRRRK